MVKTIKKINKKVEKGIESVMKFNDKLIKKLVPNK